MKNIIFSLVLGILFGIGTQSVYAAYADSSQRDYIVIGYSYYNQASIYVNASGNTGAHATTGVHSKSGNVPSGYMGYRAGLYKDNGVLCKQTSWKYNSSPLAGTIGGTGYTTSCGKGAYFSRGMTAGYNGNGYFTIETYRSPSLNY